MSDAEQCSTCRGEGGGYVRVSAEDWEWELCDRCRGAGYIPIKPVPDTGADDG